MRNFFQKLIPHRRGKGASQRSTKHGPAPPALGPRPRPLTPSGPNEALRQSASGATSNSSFFQKLPYEIRRKILIEAFGGHTVHMDLLYDHPELPVPEEDGWAYPRTHHCYRHLRANKPHGYDALVRDESVPKRWIWSGSECHRNVPPNHWAKKLNRLAAWEGDELQPSEDFCRYGGCTESGMEHPCIAWRGSDHTGCFIGAMGWLQSCRQAYAEGLEVLYTTNTIHSASKIMLLHLDKLLLPQRLSSIRSVELIWIFDPYFGGDMTPSEDLGRDFKSFYRFLDTLPGLFSGARHLHIAIQGEIFPNEIKPNGHWGSMDDSKGMDKFEKDILVPVDKMVHRLGPQALEVTLACSARTYRRARQRALDGGSEKVEQVHLGSEKERYWRELRAGEKPSNQLGGYWVQLGRRDIKPSHLYIATCFGSSIDRPLTPPEEKVFSCPFPLWYSAMDR